MCDRNIVKKKEREKNACGRSLYMVVILIRTWENVEKFL